MSNLWKTTRIIHSKKRSLWNLSIILKIFKYETKENISSTTKKKFGRNYLWNLWARYGTHIAKNKSTSILSPAFHKILYLPHTAVAPEIGFSRTESLPWRNWKIIIPSFSSGTVKCIQTNWFALSVHEKHKQQIWSLARVLILLKGR